MTDRKAFAGMQKKAILRWARHVRGYRITNFAGLTKEQVIDRILALEQAKERAA